MVGKAGTGQARLCDQPGLVGTRELGFLRPFAEWYRVLTVGVVHGGLELNDRCFVGVLLAELERQLERACNAAQTLGDLRASARCFYCKVTVTPIRWGIRYG